MTTSDETTLVLLHSLLTTCRDSAAGYETARRDMPDAQVRSELDRFRDQRHKIIHQLEQRIRDLRGDPKDAPSFGGAVHRAWIDSRAATAENPVHAILTEVERGEDFAVAAFRQALKEHDIDTSSRQMLERHYEQVQSAHDRIRQLRDRAVYALP